MKLWGPVLCGALLSVGGCRAQPPTESSGPHVLRLGTQSTPEASAVFKELLSADPLLTIDWHGRVVPRLAESWKWVDDGRGLSLTLRGDVRFHDNSPVTATSVAAILRTKIPHDSSGGFRHLTSIEAPDARTLLFRLAEADAFLVDAIAGTVITDPGQPGRRTGPFRLLPSKEGLVAEKNPGYYRGAPGIDRVEVSFFDTQRAVFAAIIRDAVDMVPEVNPESVEFLEGASQVETFPSIRPFYIPLVFNLRHPVLKNLEVRRALAQAIDRDEIVRRALHGHAAVAEDPVWPSHWAYNGTSTRRTYDPAAARARLDAAGFPVRPASGGRMASRFQLQCLFYNTDFQFERIALLLQRQLEAVGVDLIPTGVDQDTLVGRAKRGDFDTYVFQLTSGKSFDWLYRFWHSRGGIQSTGYDGADRDLDLLRLSRLDGDVRIGVATLRQHFQEDVPAAFLAWPETTRAVSARFDIGDHADPEVFGNLWRWRPGPVQEAGR